MKKHSIVTVAAMAALALAFNADIARAQTPGSLDTSFGTNGVVNATFGDGLGALPLNVFELANGELLVVLSASQTISGQTTSGIALAHYTAAGELDTTFGNGGTTYVAIANPTATEAATLDAKGNIVVATTPTLSGGGNGVGAIRLTPAGQLDTTFGVGGIVMTGTSNGRLAASNLLVQPNGQILVEGSEGPLSKVQKTQFVMVRYNSNGSLDTTFGTGGVAQIVAPTFPDPSIALLANGDYLAFSGEAITAFSPTGALLSSVVTSLAVAVTPNPTQLFLSNGNFIAASSVAPPAGSGTPTITRGLMPSFVQVAELTEAGATVPGFDETTFPYVPITSSNVDDDDVDRSGAFAAAFETNGQILVGGAVSGTGTSTSDLAIARLNANGGLDDTFGSGGTVTSSALPSFFGFLVETNGNIVIWGGAPTTSSGSVGDFGMARFLIN